MMTKRAELPDTTEAARWQRVLARDRQADGTFVFAVESTGIYCRPSCPSRRPTRSRVDFFDTPAAAEAEGYRACRRCRPPGAPPDPRGGQGQPPGGHPP